MELRDSLPHNHILSRDVLGFSYRHLDLRAGRIQRRRDTEDDIIGIQFTFEIGF